jgi:hypothetical protein
MSESIALVMPFMADTLGGWLESGLLVEATLVAGFFAEAADFFALADFFGAAFFGVAFFASDLLVAGFLVEATLVAVFFTGFLVLIIFSPLIKKFPPSTTMLPRTAGVLGFS